LPVSGKVREALCAWIDPEGRKASTRAKKPTTGIQLILLLTTSLILSTLTNSAKQTMSGRGEPCVRPAGEAPTPGGALSARDAQAQGGHCSTQSRRGAAC